AEARGGGGGSVPASETPEGGATTQSIPVGDLLPESDAPTVGVIGPERFDGDGDRKVFVRRSEGSPYTELVVCDLADAGWTEDIRITGPANPDRVAISADGETVAFVSGITGISSVWVMEVALGSEPVQITNVGVETAKRRPGQPPAGFVPPPIDAESFVFDGDYLAWESPVGHQVARWR
ncbi:MAG: hypothetical protein ABMB14_34300, partial [Myxococcota bacterium]